MNANTLQDYCKSLHISMVYSVYKSKYSENPEVTAFLNDALSAEFHTRKLNKQMKALKLAGFPTVKRFEDLNVDALPDDGRRSLPDLQTLEFLKERRNLILIGNSGTGKTHCAIAIGVQACLNEYKVLFRTAATLINELYEAKKQNRLSYLIKKLKQADLLIIDELGYISFDLEGAELLFQLLAARYEIQSTLVTSNLMFSEWVKVFHDKTLTAALLDRITHRALILNMTGNSFRRRED
ncbi:MAG TPA: IS21-like element helper ATPase IstB [Methanospirillum sp.]|jgi:DNA replication protein DnaC|uniref:IS21-like element helper ATPase IstB n=1 Tax=Methanospirillum sp. TaxID=45200 RepID=UPI002627C04F|nr:IS21-like element helper ATPase IstB [Methanospirillum sp.]HPY60909.1 IS21-like element helper ATPase IstB [Methanospirillum sp.]